MKKASIDLGTNTGLLLVKEILPSGEEVILHDESRVVRLGQGVDQTKRFALEAMERAMNCIQDYSIIAAKYGVTPNQVVAVATAPARGTANASSFFDSVFEKTGLQFKVLSGDEEARATFLGAALPEMNASQIMVIDIGGGSTELVAMPEKQNPKLMGTSLDIGAVRMTERHLKQNPVTDSEFWICEKAIDEALKSMIPWRNGLVTQMQGDPQLVGVAGTVVTLGMLQLGIEEFDRNQLDGLQLSKGDVHRWVEELKWRSVDERRLLPGMEAKRADVILAGAMILWRVMEKLEFSTLVVSTRGLRYGVLLN